MTRAQMAAVPIKPEYGPTLGRLLSPAWRRLRRPAQAAVIALLVALGAGAVGAALTLLNASYSHAGRVPFSFSYRGLYRVAPGPGELVKIQRRYPDGRLRDSFAVGPLQLPPYAGQSSGVLALYAAGYIRSLEGRYTGFVLRGEGKTRVNNVPCYQVEYTALVDGRLMWGRDVLLVPERPGARDGADIVMLTDPRSSREVKTPLEVASAGVLLRPLKTFTLG